jgi:hypothetical protein
MNKRKGTEDAMRRKESIFESLCTLRAFALNMQVIFAGLLRGIFAVSLWQVRF